ncbi:MAG TPA: C25 family cysteine peptidase [Puia sp.]|nr:C25 family cysteine peptidase [Puia sp.]
MKKFLILIMFLIAGRAFAQTYGNEWIDYSKTYYKFKLGADGLYRIPQSVIAAAGLGATDARYFQLFRNGLEVPIYTSVSSGPLGTSDYIEFWGQMNDGKPDKPLYRNPAYQHTDKWSLETDTATYFLTVEPSAPVFHYNQITNDTTTNTLPIEPYFMYTAGTYFRTMINPGMAVVYEEYIYSSSYDKGEFWSSNYSTPGNPVSDNQNNLFIYPGGPDASLKFGAAGCSDTLRQIQMKVNGVAVSNTEMDGFDDLVSTVPVPLAQLNTTSTNIQFVNVSQAVTYADRLVASFYELTYPRQFNFGGQANFQFTLPARVSGYFLKISNFNQGGAIPVLYDRATGQRFDAISSGGILTFALPGTSVARQMVLVSEDPSNIRTINSLIQKNFIAYSDPLNQGNYLIITNPVLYTGSSGNNPINDYRNYRSSVAGGGYNVQVMEIGELTDQFAYGIKIHPSAIKNFINYARNAYALKPQFVFLMGRGMTYSDYRTNQGNPSVDQLNLVPTFGSPASDVMLASPDGAGSVNLIPIGRLGAINGTEVEAYLNKVIQYEQMQQTAPNTVDARAWRKNFVHITGASDPFLEAVLCGYMNNYRQIITDTLVGAKVYQFCGSTVDADNQVSETLFPQLFANGIGVINYFGHSSSTTLGFNLDDPSVYSNQGKYPVFYANGCYAGNYYTFDPGRLANSKTISESYVLVKDKGAIAFVASSHYGVVNYLNIQLDDMYRLMSNEDYGKSIGELELDAGQRMLSQLPLDFSARCDVEEMNIHGDPAITLNDEKLPDYDIELQNVRISPSFISVSDNNFSVVATFYNLGKATPDSITVLMTRTFPDGSTTTLLRKRIPGIRFADSIQLFVPIIATRDKGQNTITVTINADNNVAETTLANNTVTAQVFIYQDELTPIYPYDYAIINNQNQKVYASTANPLAPLSSYVMEMDTTMTFNSSLKVSKNISSIGGVFEFDPGISYRDSTVYYWRTAIAAQNGQYHWNNFSFIYIDSLHSSPGFNQSHYYQHLNSQTNLISLDSPSRIWKFGRIENSVYIRNTIYPTGSGLQADFVASVNGNAILGPGCNYNELIINVLDSATFKPWVNDFSGPTGLYNSEKATCGTQREFNFDYLYTTATERKKAMDFLDIVPDNDYVIIRFNVSPNMGDNVYINQWKADTTLYGHNNSLYHKLLGLGLTLVDSFISPRAIAFIYKKNDPSFIPQQTITQGINDRTFISTNCPSPATQGTVTSPLFGPAEKWNELHWRGSSTESPSTDSVDLQVLGVDTSGNSTLLYTLHQASPDFDISSINPAQFPYIQLKMIAIDTLHATPYQLKYWRLNYVPVPEGALAPNIFISGKDTIQLGEKIQFGIAFKNISPQKFDSLSVLLKITDKNNVTHIIPYPKTKPLISGDTVTLFYEIDSRSYAGLNTVYLEVNPPGYQPEEYHFNNFVYKNFYVKSDQTNPLLDVTFDNVHILNEDIVSAKPHIMIKLKDESKYLLLNDTSLLKVQLRYPDGSLHPYYFNTDTLRFTPATNGADNTATVDFFPVFRNQIDPQGDEYTLIVTGADGSGNSTGTIQYQVSFKIITKAMISNMLNYPNPFTTSTAFVFTITGSDVPQNIKIQILTITGKIVREITKDELGPLHVGRNITEFKWDGTDMYHQRLANGVYLYHVVTNLNGKSLEQYKAEGDNTDQFFTKGYGKMYLMR